MKRQPRAGAGGPQLGSNRILDAPNSSRSSHLPEAQGEHWPHTLETRADPSTRENKERATGQSSAHLRARTQGRLQACSALSTREQMETRARSRSLQKPDNGQDSQGRAGSGLSPGAGGGESSAVPGDSLVAPQMSLEDPERLHCGWDSSVSRRGDLTHLWHGGTADVAVPVPAPPPRPH